MNFGVVFIAKWVVVVFVELICVVMWVLVEVGNVLVLVILVILVVLMILVVLVWIDFVDIG